MATHMQTGIVTGEKSDSKPEGTETVERNNNQVIDHDRDTFLPRPSDDPKDPLNWAFSLKVTVLLQVCLLAALGTINTAIINPAYSQLARDFDITIVQASYQTTVVITLNGIGPFIWVPLANVYGRRPVYLATTLLGFVSILGSAYARTYAQLIGARVVNGLFPAAMALGPSTVVDCFFLHQRGRAMGLFTVVMTTGAHIAPILGGLVGQFLGWRWIFKFTAVLDGVMFLVILLGLPETLYARGTDGGPRRAAPADSPGEGPGGKGDKGPRAPPLGLRAYAARLRPYAGPFPGARGKLRAGDFVWPALRMARYPSVLFPAAYYAAQYGFGSILPAVTVAAIFRERFGWDTLAIGLAYGGALTAGGVLGEGAAGVILDAIVKRARRRGGGVNPAPEARLQAIWTGAVLLPAGLLVYGFTIEYRTHWFVPLFGMGLSVFGLQPIATTCYTYSIDCYREQGGDVATFFNFLRQIFGMTFAFYVVLLCQRIGYQFAFLLFVIWGSVLGFVPILILMWKGREIRLWFERREEGRGADQGRADRERVT